MEKLANKANRVSFLMGLVFAVVFGFLFSVGTIKNKIDNRRATTPPSLLGIERRIA